MLIKAMECYPHSNALFLIFPLKLSYLAPKAIAVNDVKPDVSQRKVTLRYDVGFLTVNRRIYCCKYLTLSNQTFVSALEYLFELQMQLITGIKFEKFHANVKECDNSGKI